MNDSSATPATERVSGNIVDVHRRRVFPGTVVLRSGRIVEVVEEAGPYSTYLAPGFVDAHVHVESSMLPPAEFARLAVVHGTVATVSDPHEIANVAGIDGVDYMLASARQAPLKICFGAPSCVPATSFDRAGAHLGPEEVAALLARPEIGYLSEMMNYPGVIAGDAEVMAKLAAARRAGKPIDGHAPGVRGEALRHYVAAGITTDHECVALDEAREKAALGMKILIREGSAAKNFEALWPLLRESPEQCMLCSDDKHPNDLVEGHIDALVRRAVALGVDVFDAWRAASVNPVEHYRLDIGLLRPGDPADMIEVDDLETVRVLRTWIGGRLVARAGESLVPRVPTAAINRFATKPKRPADFAIPAQGEHVRVIEALDGQLVTRSLVLPATVRDGFVVSDTSADVLKMAVVDRYHDAAPAVALVKNFGLRRGAIASSVSHDSHNIVAVGASDEELARAVNLVIEVRGGISVAGPNVEAVLPLPIAGLMSDGEAGHVAREYARLDRLAKELGSPLTAPFMTLSFMALLVIPALKLGPQGLFDVEAFRPAPLFV
ncbi:MAG TPA: adenine deaminase [Pirellulales bacterium]|jgi:adenine deaminase|nr:adenine deaminase [Pirellulales bacterium]